MTCGWYMKASRVIVALCLLWLPSSHALELRGPYLTDLDINRAEVVCHTGENVDLTLEYREEKNDASDKRINSKESTQHVFCLENLKPGTSYSYCILGPEGPVKNSAPPTVCPVFTTPAQRPRAFSFIAYGDSRDSSKIPKRHREITTHFLAHAPSFVVSTGDLLIGGQHASSSMFSHDWTVNFFQPLRGVAETIQYHLTVGNHDQDSSEALEGIQKAFPRFRESFRYAFRHGDAHFIILHVANQMQEFQKQKEWFVDELKKAQDARWRIVFLHVSPFTNGKYRNSAWTLDGREDFLKTCVRQGVDVVFSGHDHSYQRFHPLRSNEQDKRSVIFVVTALSGTNPYHAVHDSYTAKVVNKTDHFCVIDVHPENLTITAYDNKNRAIDRVEVPRTGRDLGMVWGPVVKSDEPVEN